LKIVITGADGLVGSALTRTLSAEHSIVSLNRTQLNITDEQAVKSSLGSERPDLVINCAVVQVDTCELDPKLAEAVNVLGPRYLALSTPRILHFSTNYVFEGEPPGRPPYTVSDEPHPVNVYGRTKLQGEHVVIEANAQHFIVRTAWVYGVGKPSFLALVPVNLRSGRAVRAITDSFSTTTYVKDLTTQVAAIISREEYGIYHVVNSGVSSYYEFAKETARLLNLDEGEADRLIEKVSEADMKRPARRPRWTPLANTLEPMRKWQEALASYIRDDVVGG
jgi:dTDP-4-dehydrorhamnose reductase